VINIGKADRFRARGIQEREREREREREAEGSDNLGSSRSRLPENHEIPIDRGARGGVSFPPVGPCGWHGAGLAASSGGKAFLGVQIVPAKPTDLTRRDNQRSHTMPARDGPDWDSL